MHRSKLMRKRALEEAPEWTRNWDLEDVQDKLEFNEDAREVRQNIYDTIMNLPDKTKTKLYKAWNKLDKNVRNIIQKAYDRQINKRYR